MSVKLHMAALAAALSGFILAAPAHAMGATGPDVQGGPAGGEIISADGWRNQPRGPRHGEPDGYRGRPEHEGWRDDYRRYQWRHHDHMKPWEVGFRLRRRGYHDIHFVERRAPVYKLRATSPRGHRVFLVVSSRTGRIIDLYPVGRHHWR